MIELRGLSKHYGKKNVLNKVNSTFKPGNVYGIVGENGAGKTTLFRCIAGLETYDGEITASHKPLKNKLGLLLTEPYFFPRITGKEYLQLLCNAREKELVDIDQKNIFDLPLDQYAANYSTGMKKKLAILAILLQGNDYFILDEPFNGVDINSNLMLSELIQKLKALNKTVILSSHIFSTLRENCDEIYVLENGSIGRVVQKADFDLLENTMRKNSIGDKLASLAL